MYFTNIWAVFVKHRAQVTQADENISISAGLIIMIVFNHLICILSSFVHHS